MNTGGTDNHDGSDIFWPGYVDATTNLILNLLFVLTILIIAVFMFALELGRAVGPQDAVLEPPAPVEVVEPAGLAQENVALKREIERLNKLLAVSRPQSKPAPAPPKTVHGTASIAKPKSGLDTLQGSDFELVVRFREDAVSFSADERDQLIEALKPVAGNGKTLIYVEVPAGFSEAKRLGFYRALAVRNLLIEMQVSASAIDVSVVEAAADANAAVVNVRSQR